MKKRLYSKDELQLLLSLENRPNRWQAAAPDEKNAAGAAARHHVKHRKARRITIRINEEDLQGLQSLAQSEGLPYQTLIASLLHKFANRRLIDKLLFEELLARLRTA